MKILSILFILSLFIFPYIKNLYEDNKFLNEEIKIIEYESSEKEKTINILQKDIFFLKEKLKEKGIIKKPKANKKTIKEIKVGTQIPMVEIPQEIIDTTKTI